MKLQIRTSALLTIIVFASFGSAMPAPAAKLNRVPSQFVTFDPTFSMLRDTATKNKWQQEAREFDAAIKDIEGILRLDLNTQQGSDEAAAILKRNEEKLAYANSKIAAGVLKVEKLKQGVEEEARKRGGNKKFADEIKQSPSAAKNTPGLEEAGREGEASIQPAQETLKKVAAAFETASRRRASVDNLRFTAGSVFFARASFTASEACESGEPSGAATQNFCQNLGINVPTNVCNVIRNVILLYLGEVVENTTCVNLCIRTAASRYASCLTAANGVLFPANIAARATCANTLILSTGRCFLTC